MKRINWEYCECGCHGLDTTVAGIHFWKYWDIECTEQPDGSIKTREGKFYLSRDGQMYFGKHLGQFDDAAAVDAFIRKYVAAKAKEWS